MGAISASLGWNGGRSTARSGSLARSVDAEASTVTGEKTPTRGLGTGHLPAIQGVVSVKKKLAIYFGGPVFFHWLALRASARPLPDTNFKNTWEKFANFRAAFVSGTWDAGGSVLRWFRGHLGDWREGMGHEPALTSGQKGGTRDGCRRGVCVAAPRNRPPTPGDVFPCSQNLRDIAAGLRVVKKRKKTRIPSLKP